MQVPRIRPAAIGAGLVLMAGGAGVASAATTNPVVVAIRHQDSVLKSSSRALNLKRVTLNTPAHAREDLPKVRLLVRKLDQAATAVSHASVTTMTVKRGRVDWVRGTRKVADGFRRYERTLRDIERGSKTAARAEARQALKRIVAGDELIIKADRLLHIKTA